MLSRTTFKHVASRQNLVGSTELKTKGAGQKRAGAPGKVPWVEETSAAIVLIGMATVEERLIVDDSCQKEAEEQFDLKVKNMLKARKLCLDNECWEAGIMLLYSLIDAMAWLWRDPSHADVTSQDFIDWIDTYMKPDGAMGVTAMDLFGARCGLLHSMTGESRKHRELKARKVWYARQVSEGVKWLVQVYMSETLMPVTVSVDALGDAVKTAISRFRLELMKDPQLAERVFERARTAYFSEGWFGGPPVSQSLNQESVGAVPLGAVVVVPESRAQPPTVFEAPSSEDASPPGESRRER